MTAPHRRPGRWRTLLAPALAAVASALAGGCGGSSRAPAGFAHVGAGEVARRAPHDRTAPLVVSVVVDQLAAWVLDERLGALPADGGFARLVREGTRVRAMAYAHAVTDTAPGHAALYTGAIPRDSGLGANERVEEDFTGHPGRRVSILRDAKLTTLAASGKHTSGSSGPELLLVDGVADRLRDAVPDAAVVSISLKDRGAVLPGGRHPTAVIWFDASDGSFVTSTSYTDHFPGWATPLGRPEAISRLFARPWSLLDAPWVKAHAETPDAQPGEGDWLGLGTTFPHDVAATSKPFVTFRATPYADEALLSLGLAAIDHFALGRGVASLDDDSDDDESDPAERTMLLELSLSANDYVSHVFGPDSYEAWDELRRLDRALAGFFHQLDERVGADKWTAILSADHGAGLLPEAGAVAAARPFCAKGMPPDRWQRSCETLGRIVPDELAASLEKDARAALGAPPRGAWVAGVADPYVVYGEAAGKLAPARRALLTATLLGSLARTQAIAVAYDVRALPPTCPPASDESMLALVCRSYGPPRGGDLYLVTRPGFFFDSSVVVGKGESHGTPYLYDRTVPLLVRAPGRAAAGLLVERAPFGAFAHTLASLVGAPPPEAAARAPDFASILPARAPSPPRENDKR